ncbi:hypothetical protein COY87_01330 [Candidatus Roizmanbacteria bacterium CG_4_10_14_0_8_um_filter_33_9]|uniref:Glycosyl transferase family 1 domain-containing protein n=1 Tax=Candidatus Roizmanbacteria bacterium CG_4_10_14_0_8_um_filter_33_9 TaxID=1974826 RepID=A0A2M7QJ54_9BACT|nr:MAG: hypothetical protein COY87_01330 [Candidatus Roizmanbacteria bacterium CG_4_10_14_0_8_um_filter_33_9]
MKKIGIDARLYSQTGVGTYIRNLIYFLIKEKTEKLLFYLYVLPQDINKLPKLPNNFIIRSSPYIWHTFQEQLFFLFTLLKDNLDLMHFTYFGYPICYWKPFVSTIHDVTPLLFKTGKASTKSRFIYGAKLFFFKIVIYFQVRNSKVIITPSLTIKQSLIQLYGKKYENKIKPIFEGVDNLLSKTKENSNLLKNFSYLYLIYVGNFYPHKNITRLIYAFAKLKSEIKLILIGPHDFFADKIKTQISEMHLENKILFFHNASVSDLKFFYKNAVGLIHPSLSEGFGLPILEAKSLNCPLIVSDIPVFHELIDNNAIFFNPENEKDIVTKIQLFTQNTQRKNNYFSNNIKSEMSFKTMTNHTLSIYKKYTIGT